MTRTWTGQHSIWSWYGGQALQIRHPTKAQFELAERALDAVPCDRNRLLYARVDIVPAPATVSSLQITAVVASRAHRVAVHDPDVARHPWLVSATAFCLRAIEALGPSPHALEVIFALQLVDNIHNSQPEARRLLNRLGKLIPTSGVMHVEGGAEDESMRPLDFAPFPDRPSRAFFNSKIIDAELWRLANRQRKDGGWEVDFASYSPAA